MIKGIGIDIIELYRIKKGMEANTRFVDRILTENERHLFNQLQNHHRKVEFLAGRFAAKEAFAKAVGTGIGKLSFHHIEVLPDSHGAPVISAHGYEEYRSFISITHSRDYAVAQVVIEAGDS
ncbi:holo-ACP synthase [Oceanobacillus arenosus]|uniref:Holo-[acyl-carrier-protein] synthase n=1 Tax=Oceanobacillus arenosus TaxID=1229153 RepID=A0A3D8PM53_9BACI|nr:holo-ACP synthase [Oceanobacillus arenosus]RDW17170.1 holo-ACP synthase [Oceanobacillus arenosus]